MKKSPYPYSSSQEKEEDFFVVGGGGEEDGAKRRRRMRLSLFPLSERKPFISWTITKGRK